MERKIYADNALDCLNRLGKGIMNDGDEKMNASIVDTACASLPAELCERIHAKMGELCKEEAEKSGALPAEKMSELSDLRNVLQHMEKLNWGVCLSCSFLFVCFWLCRYNSENYSQHSTTQLSLHSNRLCTTNTPPLPYNIMFSK